VNTYSVAPSPHPRAVGVPPGYPSTYESVVRLADGRVVEVRPIVPSDAAELAEAIRTADAETLHARFLGAPPSPTRATLDRLTRLDYVNRFALVARSEGRGVAIARYGTLPPSEDGSVVADVAVVVRPEWRRLGVATALVELLARRALECGITDFTATFLATNRPVTELAREGQARVVIAEGAAQLDTPLATPHEDWPTSTWSEMPRQ
jgi:GNAT superfamily N-acetyltransferase